MRVARAFLFFEVLSTGVLVTLREDLCVGLAKCKWLIPSRVVQMPSSAVHSWGNAPPYEPSAHHQVSFRKQSRHDRERSTLQPSHSTCHVNVTGTNFSHDYQRKPKKQVSTSPHVLPYDPNVTATDYFPNYNRTVGHTHYDTLGTPTHNSIMCSPQVQTTESCLQIMNEVISETGEKMFVCKCCPYRSTRRNDMIVHVRRHIGEKPYKCTSCDYRSTKKSNLNAHMRCHATIQSNMKK